MINIRTIIYFSFIYFANSTNPDEIETETHINRYVTLQNAYIKEIRENICVSRNSCNSEILYQMSDIIYHYKYNLYVNGTYEYLNKMHSCQIFIKTLQYPEHIELDKTKKLYAINKLTYECSDRIYSVPDIISGIFISMTLVILFLSCVCILNKSGISF
jgi:hypothetical protein